MPMAKGHPPRRAFVVGGAGFVGTATCQALAQAGYDVVVAGRRPPTPTSRLPFVPFDLARMPVDLLAQTVTAQQPHVVINTVGSIWGRTDAQMWDAVAAPTLRLLEALTALPHRPRLIHLGSVLEYGPAEVGATTSTARSAPATTAYGHAKLAATRAVLHAANRHGWDAMVLRVANVAGPGTPAVGLLGRVAAALYAGRHQPGPTPIFLAPLNACRDYIDVRDVADAVTAAATANLSGVSIDIGRGQAVPVRELVQLLIDVSGVPAKLIETPPPASPATPPTHDWLQVDTAPARDLLGWQAHRSLRTALRDHWAQLHITADDAQRCPAPA